MADRNLYLPAIPDLPGPGMESTDRFNQAFLSTLQRNQTPSALDNPILAQIQELLNPGSGGLSPNLSRLYDVGAGKIGQAESGNIARAQTDALGRGLEGSSIEQAGIGAAQYAGEQGRATLLASLLGQQQGASSQLAQLLFGGAQQEAGFGMEQLMALLNFLSGQGESAGNLSLFGQSLGQAQDLAAKQRQSDLINTLIGAGSKAGSAFLLA